MIPAQALDAGAEAHRERLHVALTGRARRFRMRAEHAEPARRAHLLHTADQLGRLAHLLSEGAETTTHAEAWLEATDHI